MRSHNVTLEVYIPNYPNRTLYCLNVTILNRIPFFETDLEDYDMGLYWIRYYKIPKFKDLDGSPVIVVHTPTSLSDFVNFDTATNTFMFNPKEPQ